MIEVVVSMGNGDKPASTITDDLISTEEMAEIRGRQELLSYLVISMTRSLVLPHTPSIDIGDKPTVSVSELDISGEHEIASFSIEITPETIYDNVEVRQANGHLLEE